MNNNTMQKDNQPSTKYTDDQFTALDIPFKYRDYCQDDYADYLSCVRTHPKALANTLIYKLPFSEYYTFCQPLLNQWSKCQSYREKEVFEDLRQIFRQRRDMD